MPDFLALNLRWGKYHQGMVITKLDLRLSVDYKAYKLHEN